MEEATPLDSRPTSPGNGTRGDAVHGRARCRPGTEPGCIRPQICGRYRTGGRTGGDNCGLSLQGLQASCGIPSGKRQRDIPTAARPNEDRPSVRSGQTSAPLRIKRGRRRDTDVYRPQHGALWDRSAQKQELSSRLDCTESFIPAIPQIDHYGFEENEARPIGSDDMTGDPGRNIAMPLRSSSSSSTSSPSHQ